MTLACRCHTTKSTSCLYRKFHHVLLQNHSCIPSDGLDFSHPAIFQSQLHQTLHNIWHWAFPRSCSTVLSARGLPSSRISATGLPIGEQTPSTGAEFLFPPRTPTSVFKLIAVSGGNSWLIHLSHCWYPFSMGVNETLGVVAALGRPQGPPDGTRTMMVPAPDKPGASWDASYHLSCFFDKSCRFYKLLYLLHWKDCSCESRSDGL